jgi:hypothetical protein
MSFRLRKRRKMRAWLSFSALGIDEAAPRSEVYQGGQSSHVEMSSVCPRAARCDELGGADWCGPSRHDRARVLISIKAGGVTGGTHG